MSFVGNELLLVLSLRYWLDYRGFFASVYRAFLLLGLGRSLMENELLLALGLVKLAYLGL